MSLAEATTELPEFHLGDRLRKARQHKGLEQRDMATAFGVSSGTISNWEAGSQPTRGGWNTMTVVTKWSELTGVPQEWLLGLNIRWNFSDAGHRHLSAVPDAMGQMVLPDPAFV